MNQSSDMQDASDDGSPKNSFRYDVDRESSVIGPKKGEAKVPVVFSDGVEILDGEFDYDISVLNVEEYSLIMNQTLNNNNKNPVNAVHH